MHCPSSRTPQRQAWRLQNRDPQFPADGVHVGFLVDQFANLLPVSTLLALLANRGHVLAPLLNCAQRAAIFRRNEKGTRIRLGTAVPVEDKQFEGTGVGLAGYTFLINAAITRCHSPCNHDSNR
jgi:hypothetical protein